MCCSPMPSPIRLKICPDDGLNGRLMMYAPITDPATIHAKPLLRLALTEALISSPEPYPIAKAGTEDRMPKPPNIKLKIIQSTPPPIATAIPATTALA